MKFRLTIGENGTAFGKQVVIHSANAENALEFLREYVKDCKAVLDESEIPSLIEACWIDAGNGTIPIAAMNLKI